MQRFKPLSFLTLTAALALFGLSAPQAALAEYGMYGAKAGDKAEKKVEMLTEKLDLSETQAEQLRGIMQTKQEAIKNASEQYKQQFDAILTPEQKEKHEGMKEMRKDFHEAHGKHGKDCGCEMCMVIKEKEGKKRYHY